MSTFVQAAAAVGVLAALAAWPRAEGDGGKPDPGAVKACLVHYSGKVQGVGFRATAAEIARDYPVTGWVKNLPDGRVRLLVEGPEKAVDKFLEAVRTRWKGNIEKEKVEKQKPRGKFKTFEVVE
jgi:acylphosphatase